jgi:hypothetical protein
MHHHILDWVIYQTKHPYKHPPRPPPSVPHCRREGGRRQLSKGGKVSGGGGHRLLVGHGRERPLHRRIRTMAQECFARWNNERKLLCLCGDGRYPVSIRLNHSSPCIRLIGTANHWRSHVYICAISLSLISLSILFTISNYTLQTLQQTFYLTLYLTFYFKLHSINIIIYDVKQYFVHPICGVKLWIDYGPSVETA